MNNKAFTLIELLVVIAILAVLAVAVTLILNPAELIRQGRDSIRLSDLATINKALGLYQTDQIAKWMGTSTIVYTSLPDTDSTCSSYGLPSLPSGWTYNCETTTTYTNVDGTGWLPVNFTNMSFSSPLARLPLDPVNNATTSKYYTYVTGGSWELSAVMEAVSNKLGGDNDRVSKDGGEYADIYETGTNLELLPVNRNPNLVGYWKFDEGTGTSVYDASGSGNDGTISTGTSSVQWVSGKKNGALDFDGVDDFVNCGNNDSLDITNAMTVAAWVRFDYLDYTGGNGNLLGIAGKGHPDNPNPHSGWWFSYDNRNNAEAFYFTCFGNTEGGSVGGGNSFNSSLHYYTFTETTWYYLVFTINSSEAKLYINGVQHGVTKSISNLALSDTSKDLAIGQNSSGWDFNGLIDDIRIYNRALSAAEIQAMYNSY